MSDRKVDSVFVFCTDQPAVAIDQVDALHWSAKWSHRILIVDTSPRGLGIPSTADYEILRFGDVPQQLPGFLQLQALSHLVNEGWQFGQAILLQDDTLPIGHGIDEWCGLQIKTQNAGLIGVEDRTSHYLSFTTCSELFSAWDVPHEIWEDAPSTKTPHEAFLVLSAQLIRDMFERMLLPPPDCHAWHLPFGPYISWVAQMLEYSQLLQGHMDRPLAPLYVNSLRGRQLPPPTILRSEFLVYHSLKQVSAFSANDLRLGYKRLRDSDAK